MCVFGLMDHLVNQVRELAEVHALTSACARKGTQGNEKERDVMSPVVANPSETDVLLKPKSGLQAGAFMG